MQSHVNALKKMPINVTINEDDKKFLECLKILLGGSKVIKVIGAFLSGEKGSRGNSRYTPGRCHC